MVALSPHELRFVLVRVELSRRDVVHLRLSELTVDKLAQTILTELTARLIQTIPLLMDYSISITFHLSMLHAIITTSIMQLYISCQNTCIHTAMRTIRYSVIIPWQDSVIQRVHFICRVVHSLHIPVSSIQDDTHPQLSARLILLRIKSQ